MGIERIQIPQRLYYTIKERHPVDWLFNNSNVWCVNTKDINLSVHRKSGISHNECWYCVPVRYIISNEHVKTNPHYTGTIINAPYILFINGLQLIRLFIFIHLCVHSIYLFISFVYLFYWYIYVYLFGYLHITSLDERNIYKYKPCTCIRIIHKDALIAIMKRGDNRS